MFSEQGEFFEIVCGNDYCASLQALNEKLKQPGRILMLSAITYFDPNTVLLDKPKICIIASEQPGKLQTYAQDIESPQVRSDFIKLLRDFGENDYIRIENKWCNKFKKYLPRSPRFGGIKRQITKLKHTLDFLEEKRSKPGYSVTHPDIRNRKRRAVEDFISSIKDGPQ